MASVLRHWRAGTLGKRLSAALGRPAVASKVRWHGADSRSEALEALFSRARAALSDKDSNAQALIIGHEQGLAQALAQRLAANQLAYSSLSLEQALALSPAQARSIAIVLCADTDARRQTQAARALADHPLLSRLPFEHAAGLDDSRAIFKRLDEYADTDFVSPVLLEEPTPYAIYQESLQYFEQKCGLRDYLDLYQLIKSVVDNGVPGDIAEFGSYRGHSGWLIARSLEALGSDKQLFMFDTFEAFPEEAYGVDHFWSATHTVDFEQVSAKFADRSNVTLVRGDFTQTLADSPVSALALAYVDCDSYRATRYLLDALPTQYLSQHGILVCEDYGHPALLGNRAAVHEALDTHAGWFRYFSQFSGLYIAVKMQVS